MNICRQRQPAKVPKARVRMLVPWLVQERVAALVFPRPRTNHRRQTAIADKAYSVGTMSSRASSKYSCKPICWAASERRATFRLCSMPFVMPRNGMMRSNPQRRLIVEGRKYHFVRVSWRSSARVGLPGAEQMIIRIAVSLAQSPNQIRRPSCFSLDKGDLGYPKLRRLEILSRP
jgi:hypothetical protein